MSRTAIPQSLIDEAEKKTAEYQLAKTPDHPCRFGVIRFRNGTYGVAALFPHVLAAREPRVVYVAGT